MIVKQKNYYAGIYLRFSDDETTNSESSSISTQRKMLNQYCLENMIPIACEYCDDGWTGSNFERPAFQRMLADIYDGKVNLVITKDLSRFGRNYLETGTFIERVFDDHNIRYIAIDDNVDTLKGEYDIMMPIKNVINDLYSKDISRKTKSALNAKAKNGEYLASKAAYGYMKNPENNHSLIIDPSSSEVVKRIFHLASISYGYNAIVRHLTKNKILTPQSYFVVNNPTYYKENNFKPHTVWNIRTVQVILDNPIYLGQTVYGKTRSKKIRSKIKTACPEDAWIIKENTHEAIISKELWDAAHENLKKRARICANGEVHIFSGFLFCKDCGASMAFNNRDFKKEHNGEFMCGSYKRKGREYCMTHYITFENVYNFILNDIKKNASKALGNSEKYREYLCKQNIDDKNHIRKITFELEKMKTRNAEIDGIINTLYEDICCKGRKSNPSNTVKAAGSSVAV